MVVYGGLLPKNSISPDILRVAPYPLKQEQKIGRLYVLGTSVTNRPLEFDNSRGFRAYGTCFNRATNRNIGAKLYVYSMQAQQVRAIGTTPQVRR
jgi:hypothetical protein